MITKKLNFGSWLKIRGKPQSVEKTENLPAGKKNASDQYQWYGKRDKDVERVPVLYVRDEE